MQNLLEIAQDLPTSKEKMIFRFQHVLNYMNCRTLNEQHNYINDMIRNIDNYKDYIYEKLIPLLLKKK